MSRYSKPHIFWCPKHASWVCQKMKVGPRPMLWVYAFGFSPEAATRYIRDVDRVLTSTQEPRKVYGAKP